MGQECKILIVDEQPRSRQSLKALFATWRAAVQVQDAPDGDQALCLAQELQPDVIVMDMRVVERDGGAVARAIKDHCPHTRLVLLSFYSDTQPQALAAGADAFVLKGTLPEYLLSVVGSLMAGRAVLPG